MFFSYWNNNSFLTWAKWFDFLFVTSVDSVVSTGWHWHPRETGCTSIAAKRVESATVYAEAWFTYARKLSSRKLRDRHLSTVAVVRADWIFSLKTLRELNCVLDPSTRHRSLINPYVSLRSCSFVIAKIDWITVKHATRFHPTCHHFSTFPLANNVRCRRWLIRLCT